MSQTLYIGSVSFGEKMLTNSLDGKWASYCLFGKFNGLLPAVDATSMKKEEGKKKIELIGAN